MDKELYKILYVVREYAKVYNITPYIVGGFIRDYLLGKNPRDIDFLIHPFNVDFIDHIVKILNGRLVILDEERKYFRIVIKNKEKTFVLDFTPIYQQNLLFEIIRRDFTINSIVLNLKNFKIFDPLRGLEDLERNVIKLSSPNSLREDPLRILRVFRFGASGFKIDKNVLENIEKNSQNLSKIKPERIHEEIYKILKNPFTSHFWKEMEEYGVLKEIFPELSKIKYIPWSKPHHENPLDHSITTLYVLEDLFYNMDFLFPSIKKDLENYFSKNLFSEFTKKETLKLTSLLHDIGKSKTYSIDEENLVHYYGHSKVGAEMIKEIAERLKLSNKELTFIQKLIRNHMYLIDLIKNPEIKTIHKLISRVNEDVPSLVFLFISDQIAIKGNFENKDYFEKLLEEFFKLKNIPKPLLSGHEIMQLFNLNPSPIVGTLKEKLIEAQIEERVKTKEEAIKFLREILENERYSSGNNS
ncbi:MULTISPECIES: CCA tRNA nucleotidyltransferase [Dictyoglomus]|jgi:poly(A) polymerase|uniref:Polynucleotide adenylyltransferase/metal dependent phosphohydrolase n=1 Tax=Dictyoglomus turgidum (strain DSM 6724 / Z-1310) TaxID=515635 RepID=B8E2F1_DICTD|nr:MULTISPECIES: HD domain-containing protein [Dictyoglomus]ACK42795.1 polynucleotide adenylyltransferase/metal dependent phosphohydrolase [Dictyoglomus turgidum DSM 6724]PNV80997.1 MAG: HDIG domain-containing protein [Dictyoglomus turgidum]HBU30854.1 HDIG domain-containing protein [Dictyoglomus sp.]